MTFERQTGPGMRWPRKRREERWAAAGGRGGKRRRGSRALLAAALIAGVLFALAAGVHISDFLCDLAGISSTRVRLGGKVAAIVILLPAGFYVVERMFLSGTTQGRRDRGND
ncbi:MAG TPA: hypothetical protein VE080_02035 [Candidatus Aquicultoraceae bacterium]|jgi:hypothetical protein|nr:hypothetical protein [Candidatus Aquicultoraceae bacterium]